MQSLKQLRIKPGLERCQETYPDTQNEPKHRATSSQHPPHLQRRSVSVNSVPAAAIATGDVLERDNLCDVIFLIERQRQLRLENIALSAQRIAKGRRLLDLVKISNPVDRVMAHEQNLSGGWGDPQYFVCKHGPLAPPVQYNLICY